MTFARNDSEFWRDHVLVSLCLRGKKKAHASFELRLVDKSKGPFFVHKEAPRKLAIASHCPVKRDMLKAVTTGGDCLTIECTVTVYKKPWITQMKSLSRVEVPHSDIAEQFGKLLETKDGVNVSFIVGGETFAAHKIVLATRSAIFKAEHFEPLRKHGMEPITIKDLQPAVFRALLHFIYTDSIPAMDDLKGGNLCEMIRHLLVAADRYAIERLSLMCQSIICEDLQVHNVATTSALADQHGCDILKDACIEFMICSNSMEAVAATNGSKNLKRSCPSVVIEALENTSKARRE